MGFFVSKLLWVLLRPSTFVVLVGCLGVLLARAGRSRPFLARQGWRLTALSLGFLLSCLVLPIDQWLLTPLENRFPSPPAPAHVDGIITLGGAVDPFLTARHHMPALNEAAERMTSFVGLANKYPGARLAFAGGSGVLGSTGLTESDVAAALFTELGLLRPIIYDRDSRTTQENAVLLKEAVGPRPGETWLLITSASHMPRAVGMFRRAGWPVIPWPVGYKASVPAPFSFQPSLPDRLGSIDTAVHEWLGLVAYRLLGRTDTLFPKP